MSKIKLISLEAGEHVRVRDKTMLSPQEAKVIGVFKRTVRIKLPDGQEKLIHRKYVLQKLD